MNPIGWIEIPVSDMNRAIAFYNSIFEWDISAIEFGGFIMAWFPNDHESYGCSGSLVHHEDYQPSLDGAVVYFACEDMSAVLSRVKGAGGKVLQDKKQISPEHGFMGLIIDSEGNRIALHSQK